MKEGEVIAKCPSCSLTIRIVYDNDSYKEYEKVMAEAQAWLEKVEAHLFLEKCS